MSRVKGTVQYRICLCQCGMHTVLLQSALFAFYACTVEVEGSRWGAGFIGFAMCKLGTVNITGRFWKL